jgi:hypothetical protein
VKVQLHERAQADIDDAALWYDEHEPGLGDEFLEMSIGICRRFLISLQSGHFGRERDRDGIQCEDVCWRVFRMASRIR